MLPLTLRQRERAAGEHVHGLHLLQRRRAPRQGPLLPQGLLTLEQSDLARAERASASIIFIFIIMLCAGRLFPVGGRGLCVSTAAPPRSCHGLSDATAARVQSHGQATRSQHNACARPPVRPRATQHAACVQRLARRIASAEPRAWREVRVSFAVGYTQTRLSKKQCSFNRSALSCYTSSAWHAGQTTNALARLSVYVCLAPCVL